MGWFGGSFDPPHKGHVAVARAAADAFGLDVVLLAPVGRQPLKDGLAMSAFEDRLAMVRLACSGEARLLASGLDGPRENGGPNYTVDALERLRGEYPGAEVFGIVGMDAYLQMPLWKEHEQLRLMVEWVVVTRPGYATDGVAEGVHLLETVWMDMSATMLRERLRHGEDCGELIDDAVRAYIAEHRLYGSGG